MTKRMSHIRRNMKKENTEYRPEQLLLAKIFRELLGKDYQVYTEYPVSNLKPYESLKVRAAIPDIAIIGKGMKIAVRLMGEIHDSLKKQIKDEDQKIVLMYNGWKVCDIRYYDYPELWDQKKHTFDEAKLKMIQTFKLEDT